MVARGFQHPQLVVLPSKVPLAAPSPLLWQLCCSYPLSRSLVLYLSGVGPCASLHRRPPVNNRFGPSDEPEEGPGYGMRRPGRTRVRPDSGVMACQERAVLRGGPRGADGEGPDVDRMSSVAHKACLCVLCCSLNGHNLSGIARCSAGASLDHSRVSRPHQRPPGRAVDSR